MPAFRSDFFWMRSCASSYIPEGTGKEHGRSLSGSRFRTSSSGPIQTEGERARERERESERERQRERERFGFNV